MVRSYAGPSQTRLKPKSRTMRAMSYGAVSRNHSLVFSQLERIQFGDCRVKEWATISSEEREGKIAPWTRELCARPDYRARVIDTSGSDSYFGLSRGDAVRLKILRTFLHYFLFLGFVLFVFSLLSTCRTLRESGSFTLLSHGESVRALVRVFVCSFVGARVQPD